MSVRNTEETKQIYTELLLRLVSIDSSNPPGLEKEMIEAVTDFLGFDLFWDDNGEAVLQRRPSTCPALSVRYVPVSAYRGSLIFRLQGQNPEGALAFTGHMDVVPVSAEEYSRWDTNPFRATLKEGRIYGRGSTDMKGGLAAAMLVLRERAEAVRAGAPLPSRDLFLLATCDEESDMLGSRACLDLDFLRRISGLVVCEPTGLRLCAEGRGRTYAKLTLRGATGHGSLHATGNVIHRAGELLHAMEQEDFSEYTDPYYGASFWQCLSVHAAKEPCVVPDTLEMVIDARLAPQHPCEEVWHRMTMLLDRLFPEDGSVKAELKILDSRQGWQTGRQSRVRTLTEASLQELGIGVRELLFSGSTDGSKLRLLGMEPVIIGPGDLDLAHRENESVELEEALRALELYRLLAEKWENEA